MCGPVELPHKRPAMQKAFPCVIMRNLHGHFIIDGLYTLLTRYMHSSSSQRRHMSVMASATSDHSEFLLKGFLDSQQRKHQRPCHCLLWRKPICDRWIPLTKGRNPNHVMTSSHVFPSAWSLFRRPSMIHWFVECMIFLLIDRMIDVSIDRLIDCLFGWLNEMRHML